MVDRTNTIKFDNSNPVLESLLSADASLAALTSLLETSLPDELYGVVALLEGCRNMMAPALEFLTSPSAVEALAKP